MVPKLLAAASKASWASGQTSCYTWFRELERPCMLVCLDAGSPAAGAVLAESGTFKWRDLAAGSWTLEKKALRWRAWPGFLSASCSVEVRTA